MTAPPMAQGLADEFEKPSWPPAAVVVKREFTNDKATDFTAILTNIKVKPDRLLRRRRR